GRRSVASPRPLAARRRTSGGGPARVCPRDRARAGGRDGAPGRSRDAGAPAALCRGTPQAGGRAAPDAGERPAEPRPGAPPRRLPGPLGARRRPRSRSGPRRVERLAGDRSRRDGGPGAGRAWTLRRCRRLAADGDRASPARGVRRESLGPLPRLVSLREGLPLPALTALTAHVFAFIMVHAYLVQGGRDVQ